MIAYDEIVATHSYVCGHCGRDVEGTVVAGSLGTGGVGFLQCSNPQCGDGSVKTKSGVVYPAPTPGRPIANLPADIETAWTEARRSYAVGAFTASEMMLRKILMHVGVDVAGIPAGKNYIDYVNELEAKNYLAVGLKPVIDKVRARGNSANHELPASTEEEAKVTMAITDYLLRGIYELPGL